MVSPPTHRPTPTTFRRHPTPVAGRVRPAGSHLRVTGARLGAGSVPCGSASCLALAQHLRWRSHLGVGAGSRRHPRRPAPGPDRLGPVRRPLRTAGSTPSTRPGCGRPTTVAPAGARCTWPALTPAQHHGHGGRRRARPSGGPIPANATTVHVESSPVGSDAWTDTDTGVPVGAGPVPSTQLVLQGTRAGCSRSTGPWSAGPASTAPGSGWPWTPPVPDGQRGRHPGGVLRNRPGGRVPGGDLGPAQQPARRRHHPVRPGCSTRATAAPASRRSARCRRGYAGAVTASPSARRRSWSPVAHGADCAHRERLVGSFDGGQDWPSSSRAPTYSRWHGPGVHHATPGRGHRVPAVRIVPST